MSMKPNIISFCLSFNERGRECNGDSRLDKKRFCYKCRCYIKSGICEYCNDTGVITKDIYHFINNKSKSIIVEEFCDCKYGIEKERSGYSLAVMEVTDG